MNQVVESNDFNEIYKKLVDDVLKHGRKVQVKNKSTYELLNQQINLTNIQNSKLDFTNTQAHWRQSDYDNYLKAEIKWYESGSISASTSPSPKVWKTFADSQGNIQSNYGHLILYKKNDYSLPQVTAYENVIALLKSDEHSRQALMHYNYPEHYKNNMKDIPCTVSTQVFIREDKLMFSVFQRSCDLYTGIVYDLPWHCHLMNKMVHKLKKKYANLTAGSLTMFFGSLHIYNQGKDMNFFNDYQQHRLGKSA